MMLIIAIVTFLVAQRIWKNNPLTGELRNDIWRLIAMALYMIAAIHILLFVLALISAVSQ